MQVFKVFFQILFKQKGQIFMYLGIFFGIALLTSSQGQDTENMSFEPSSYQFAVFDEDQSVVSKGLIHYLEKDNERVEIKDSKESIQDELYNRNIYCVLRIPKRFGESLRDGGKIQKIDISSVPGTIYKQTFESLASQYITILRGCLMGGYTDEEAVKRVQEIAKKEISVKVKESGSTEHSYLYFFFAYVPYILLSLCIVGIAPVLVVFHKKDVRDRILCASYSLTKTNRELILGTLAAGLVFGILFFICAIIGSGGDVLSMKGLLFGLNTFAFLFVALSIVFLMGQLLKKTSSISMASNVCALGMSFLTGVFVPLEYLGDGIISLAHFLPSYWYILGVRLIDSGLEKGGFSQLCEYMGIQLLFAVAIIAVGLAYSKAKTTGVSFSAGKVSTNH